MYDTPFPDKILVIILGAHTFKKASGFTSSIAFKNSADRFRKHLLDNINLPEDNLLDLFDSNDTFPSQDENITNFLERRIADKTPKITDILIFYIGHGGFSKDGSDYFLAIRDTRANSEFFSSYPIKALANTLKESARNLRKYIILDSCFSASAYEVFQSSTPLEIVRQKTLSEFPIKGTALLCASGPKDPAKILPSQEFTMFSETLLDILENGVSDFHEPISLKTLGELTYFNIKEKYLDEAVRPQVLSPDQRSGDISNFPLFPNKFSYNEQDINEKNDTLELKNDTPELIEEIKWFPKLKEDIEWVKVRIANQVHIYDNFLQKYPSSQFSQLAIDRINELKEAETIFWNKIKTNKNYLYFAEYLRLFPFGIHSEIATEIVKFAQSDTPYDTIYLSEYIKENLKKIESIDIIFKDNKLYFKHTTVTHTMILMFFLITFISIFFLVNLGVVNLVGQDSSILSVLGIVFIYILIFFYIITERICLDIEANSISYKILPIISSKLLDEDDEFEFIISNNIIKIFIKREPHLKLKNNIVYTLSLKYDQQFPLWNISHKFVKWKISTNNYEMPLITMAR